jgi:hypothetical protein
MAAFYRPDSHVGPFDDHLRAAERQGPREAAAAFAHAIRAARLAVKSWREWQDANYRLGPRPSPDLPHVFIDPYRTRELIAHLWGGFLYWKALARVRPAAPSVRVKIPRTTGHRKAIG